MGTRFLKCLCIVCCCLIGAGLFAQPSPPKREFRAAWVCTLANLDWPSKAGLSSESQQKEFVDILDKLQRIGMNAVVVQVRPAGDAMYPSDLSPWSQYLMGKQGQAPSPFYDPLEFMVEEAHKRNMEFHAWFNPFRAVSHVRFCTVTPTHPSRKNPDWCYLYGETRYYDPGNPAVRSHLQSVVMEVVRKYDVDGIHLDDYFYPYPKSGESIDDAESYARYGGKYFPSKGDWRRHNIDTFVKGLGDSIRTAKPWLKYGISPFGVWRNKEEDARGSQTVRALASYDGLYADSRKWIQEGWVDYMAPQLYWNIDHPRASYRNLLMWWDELETSRHVYVGHATYLMSSASPPAWASTAEFVRQASMTRESAHIGGNIWFRSASLVSNPQGISDVLRTKVYPYPAIPPAMPWRDSIPPLRPGPLQAVRLADGVSIAWSKPLPAEDGQEAAYFIVYRFADIERCDLEDPRNILSVQRGMRFFDDKVEPGQEYYYAVTSVDRSNNESRRFVYQRVRIPL